MPRLIFLTLMLAVMLAVMLVPAVSSWDHSISQRVQQLRSPAAAVDHIVLAVTRSADLRLATAVVIIVLVGMLAVQHWWLAIQLSCVSLGALLSGRIIKSLLGRVRPELADSGVHQWPIHLITSGPAGMPAQPPLSAGCWPCCSAIAERQRLATHATPSGQQWPCSLHFPGSTCWPTGRRT